MRLGIFGGSFDPVHNGHLILAEYALEQLRLDKLHFLPAATAPHKQGRASASAEDRIEMLKLVVSGNERFAIDRREVEQGGVSYTVETLRVMYTEDNSRELFLLLGGDSIADLPNWREPAEICRLALPVAVARPGHAELDFAALAPLVDEARLQQVREHVVEMPLIELSSTEIRRRVATGASIRYQTPRAVEKYIQMAGLYR